MAHIIKLTDEKFDNNHPNNINVGFEKNAKDSEVSPPLVGYCCWVGSFRTSTVTEIISSENGITVFRTENSVYKLTMSTPSHHEKEAKEETKKYAFADYIFDMNFLVWYSGMKPQQIISAHERYVREVLNKSAS